MHPNDEGKNNYCLNSGTQNRIGFKATARINSIAIQTLVIIKVIHVKKVFFFENKVKKKIKRKITLVVKILHAT